MLRKLILENDCDVDSPTDWDGWKVYSFNSRHVHFKHPNEFDVKHDIGLRSKFRAGLAYWLSYHEHGNCLWTLNGGGPRCPFDTRDMAGILIWTGKPDDLPRDKRKESAESFLKAYTDWCNGNCYYFRLEDADGNDITGCGGFIGNDVGEGINEYLNNDDHVYATGEASGMAQYLKLKGRLIDRDEWERSRTEQPEYAI